MRRSIRLFALCLIPLTLLIAAPAAAQPRSRYFPETGYTVSDPILSYWERSGGLPVFGYPISPLQNEMIEGSWSGPVQWFERDRLEDHSATGEGVLAGRLGARLLELQLRPWQYGPYLGPQRGCSWFVQTGYQVCATFRDAWLRMGGLERFGYPISEPREEIIEGKSYTVQYFERRRMEYHPENAGTPYAVLLGLLGREVRSLESGCSYQSPILQRTWADYARDLGCFTPYSPAGEQLTIAIQPFQGGEMVWLPGVNGGPGQILVIYRPRGDLAGWAWYADGYVEGEPLSPVSAPPGLYAPTRGFGKLWRTVPELREQLGWASAPERALAGTVLRAFSGSGFSWMVHRGDIDFVYILSAAGGAREAPLVR